MTSNTGATDRASKQAADLIDIPSSDTSVYQALYRRRMSWRFSDAPVPREAVQRMLDAAIWAPNHRLTEPWRFFVLEKNSQQRREAGELAYQFSLEQNNNPAQAEAAREKVMAASVLVFAYCTPGRDEEATRENYASVCCAIQNMSLAGVAEGLAVTWDTGRATRHPRLKELLGAEDDWLMTGMLSIGVAAEQNNAQRTPVSNFVRWFE